MSKECKVWLKSSDDELFEVDLAVAFRSQLIKHMMEDTKTDNPMPLLNVSSKILAKVIDYCKYHVDAAKSIDEKSAIGEDDVKVWEQEFVKVNQIKLFDLLRAANYLNIKKLQDLTCKTVADMIRCKSRGGTRKMFSIKNENFIPEKKEEVRQ